MKKRLFLFFFLFIPLFSQDRIVAIVGNKVIFENDVLRKSKIEKIDYSTSLNSLIEEKLLLCQAEKENIEVKDEEIKNEIERMKRSFKTLNDFYNYLKISGLSLSQIESEIENNLKIKKLVREKIIKKIEITPVEIANEMEKIEGKYCEYEFYFKWFDNLTSCEEFIKNFSAKSLDEMEYAKLKSLEIIDEILNLLEKTEKGNLSDPIFLKGKYLVLFLKDKIKIDVDKYTKYKEAKDKIFKIKYAILYRNYIEELKKSIPVKIL